MTQTESSSIRADIIILGSSLPGIVTAYKLKNTLGDSTHILVLDLLDLQYNKNTKTEQNIWFQDDIETEEEIFESTGSFKPNIARTYIFRYAQDLGIKIPLGIMQADEENSKLKKLFQYENGNTTYSEENYHNFSYLGYYERRELLRYQVELDSNMEKLFGIDAITNTAKERYTLMYYDITSMEEHICEKLAYEISKNIMRNTVFIVCGVPAYKVSLLFYLHQCYRNSSCKNILDNDNVRIREKVIGYFFNTISEKLLESISDITISTKSVVGIRSYSDEKFLLQTLRGERYICDMLAMAVTPEQLEDIEVETDLLSEKCLSITKALKKGKIKKFYIKYKENFWKRQGFSGDILSVKGPIIWAFERPQISKTGDLEDIASLEGFLKVAYEGEPLKFKVIDQLMTLFGSEAAYPSDYTEKDIRDIFIPRFGDYVELRSLFEEEGNMCWGTLNIFQEGDVASAIEAGHTVYLKILSILRPQAQTFDDIICQRPYNFVLPQGSVFGSFGFYFVRLAIFTGLVYAGFKARRHYLSSG